MANRDRLAQLRAQQGGGAGGYPDTREQSYPQQGGGGGGGGGGGYQARRANPYAQQDGGQYELDAIPARGAPAPMNGGGGAGDLQSFYAEISSLQDAVRALNDDVAGIGELQTRALNTTSTDERTAEQLAALVERTGAAGGELKRRIQALERANGGRDAQVRKQQTALVKSKFVEALQNYQQVEQQYRSKLKQRMERQYRIVKPDATPEEVRAVVNDDAGAQVFSQALLNSNRYGESRAAYREVQERHADIKKIEKTLGELAQLFQDMSILVAADDDKIAVITENTTNIDVDVSAGFKDTERAVDSARGARRKRWICFWICVLIVIVIAVVVVVVLKPWVKK